jgi:hypothetical protein
MDADEVKEEIEHQHELRKQYHKRLMVLEEQRAGFGDLYVPPHIQIEIDELNEEMGFCDKEILKLKVKKWTYYVALKVPVLIIIAAIAIVVIILAFPTQSDREIPIRRALTRYYMDYADGNYESALNMLSEEFRQQYRITSIDIYKFMRENYGAPFLQDIKYIHNSDNEAEARLELLYEEKNKCFVYTYKFKRDYNRGQSRFGYWLFISGIFNGVCEYS